MPEVISFLIQTVAPLHLGCDEVYEPFNAVIDKDQKCLIAYDPYDFLARLPDEARRRFLQICQKGSIGSILEIYKFMANHVKLAHGRAVPVTTALLQHYERVLNLREQEFSQQMQKFLIHRSAFLPQEQRPYIPGTAIKGALRTAYLNSLAQQEAIHLAGKEREDGRLLEGKLLKGSFQTDPFRLLK
ncbi:MAG: type III-A CRISPR-associated RAMP protein Csm5, partial [Desulfobacca sp.]|uniref:type III-A CRISPR-associated RAMP protein Csm5 n=1 Tax=Desulfobacca sp. TaxID=2067990 RepID=UPI00404B37C2